MPHKSEARMSKTEAYERATRLTAIICRWLNIPRVVYRQGYSVRSRSSEIYGAIWNRTNAALVKAQREAEAADRSPVDPAKKYITFNGKPVEIMYIERRGPCPVYGFIDGGGGNIMSAHWTIDGYVIPGDVHPFDLVEVKAEVESSVSV